MNGDIRREKLLKLIEKSDIPLSGSALAREANVSRQVIVHDIALLKAAGFDILSTNKGYVLNTKDRVSCVVIGVDSDDEVGDELNLIVDMGGYVEDVFVWHRIYGKIKAELNIASRRNVAEYIESLENGRSSPLKKVTSDYHYHTVTAENEEDLDLIEAALDKRGFLVRDE